MMEDCKTGALYIRVSTDDQTEYSPDSQIKLCMRYAKDHNIEILSEHIYKEDGISGTKADKRPEFQKMIAIAKTKPKPFDIILVYDFSRFARNKAESVIYKNLLRQKLDIDVISITQPLSNGKDRIILESMYEAMDEYYSINLSENSLRGKIEKASRGEHQGNPPYGYNYDKNTKMIIINEERANIVKLVFNEWIKPETTIRQIVLKLNAMNIKTARDCLWTDRNLHILLRNPAYIGYTRFTIGGMKRNWHNPNTKITKGKHEPIIDINTWDKAQEKMKQHDDTWFKYKKPQVKNEHWLRGIVKCSDCGKSLVKIKVYNRTAYFQCAWYTKARCCHNHYVREDILVHSILEEIKQVITGNLNICIVQNNDLQDNNEISILENQLLKSKSKLKRIENAYMDGIDNLDEYKTKKQAILKEIDNLELELNDINIKFKKESQKEQIYKLCETAYTSLSDPNVNDEIKSEISHKLFDSIVYNKEKEELCIKFKEII